MAIRRIETGASPGLQVCIFRGGKVVASRFLSYKKHGGRRKVRREAKRLETEMDADVSQRLRAKPNRNSSSGITGIRAFVVQRAGQRPALQFSAHWRSGPKQKRVACSFQRSSAEYGILEALRQVLAARAEGTGLPMPSPRKAWAIIKASLLAASGGEKKMPAVKKPTKRLLVAALNAATLAGSPKGQGVVAPLVGLSADDLKRARAILAAMPEDPAATAFQRRDFLLAAGWMPSPVPMIRSD